MFSFSTTRNSFTSQGNIIFIRRKYLWTGNISENDSFEKWLSKKDWKMENGKEEIYINEKKVLKIFPNTCSNYKYWIPRTRILVQTLNTEYQEQEYFFKL